MLRKNKKGQSTAEYAIVASAILLAVAGAATRMGAKMETSLGDLGDRAAGQVDQLLADGSTVESE